MYPRVKQHRCGKPTVSLGTLSTNGGFFPHRSVSLQEGKINRGTAKSSWNGKLRGTSRGLLGPTAQPGDQQKRRRKRALGVP